MKKCIFILTAVLSSAFLVDAQDIVKGRVVDKKGNPLPGAVVSIKHTPEVNDTAIVDKDGNFEITWSNPYEKKMIVTYPGMNTRKLNVKKDGMNVKMAKTTWWNQAPTRPELYVGLQAGFPTYGAAHPAMGIMVGYFKKVGAYAKVMANLDYAGDVDYDGRYAFDGYYTNKTKLKYMSGALGMTIRLKSPFYLNVGAAIGKRKLYWQKPDGLYYERVNDDPGFSPDISLMFRYKHLAINAGMCFGFNFGVGYIF